MINEIKPLSMPEAIEILEASEEEREIKLFIEKFTKLKIKEAKEMKSELENLSLVKVKEEHIVKIIDLMPEDASDINKIFSDVSLDENEINSILEITKKYK